MCRIAGSVPTTSRLAEGATVYRTIVVGTDGSSTADTAVEIAGELARACGAAVHVVTAYRPVRSAVLAGVSAMGGAVPAPAWLGGDERVAAGEGVRRAGER